MNQITIKKEVVLKVLTNFHARTILELESFLVHIYPNPFSKLEPITIHTLCAIRGLGEDYATDIEYVKETMKRHSNLFNQIASQIPKIEPYQYLKDIQAIDVNEIITSIKEGSLTVNLLTLFPTLSTYIVPGEVHSNKRVFILFFPYWYNSDYDYSVLKYLEKNGFTGSTVIRLPMHGVSKLVYSLIMEKKVDAILNFYDHGGSCYDWHWNQEQMKSELSSFNIDPLEFIKLINCIPKNYYGDSGDGGFDFPILNEIFSKLLQKN